MEEKVEIKIVESRDFEMPKQKKVRSTDEQLSRIKALAEKGNVSEAELLAEWEKAFVRLDMESYPDFGESLKNLRMYMANIELLFSNLVKTTNTRIEDEQIRAIEFEQELTVYQEMYRNQLKNHHQEMKEKEKELKEVRRRNAVLQEENERLTKEITELKEKAGNPEPKEEQWMKAIQDLNRVGVKIDNLNSRITDLTRDVQASRPEREMCQEETEEISKLVEA